MAGHRDIDNMTAIFETAVLKYGEGERKYGRYDPATDTRDFLQETEAEIIDAINYLAMFLMKIRAIRTP